MLIDIEPLIPVYNIKIGGVIHVGAHLGEEAELYSRCGIRDVIWIEGNEALIPKLQKNVRKYGSGNRVIHALVSDQKDDKVVFNIANNGQSSSILEFGTHSAHYPEVRYVSEQVHLTTRIDDLAKGLDIDEKYNFINLDLQGAELKALRGAIHTLKNIDYVYTEVNAEEVYKGCNLISEVDNFLVNFVRVETCMVAEGWGDALYVRTK